MFVTQYNFTEFVYDYYDFIGFAYKVDQINPPTSYQELSFCFRINLDVYLNINDYTTVLDFLDGGGWEGGKEVKKDQIRTTDFRIRGPIVNGHLLRMKTFLTKVLEAR